MTPSSQSRQERSPRFSMSRTNAEEAVERLHSAASPQCGPYHGRTQGRPSEM